MKVFLGKGPRACLRVCVIHGCLFSLGAPVVSVLLRAHIWHLNLTPEISLDECPGSLRRFSRLLLAPCSFSHFPHLQL